MITREKSEKGMLKLHLTLSSEVWQKAVEAAYERTKGKYNVQGFRKGKAPRKVIEKNYGDTVFYDAAFEDAVSNEYAEFLEKNPDVEPADYPHVAINAMTADTLDVTLSVVLMPEVVLSTEATSVKKETPKVSAKEVDEQLARFAESQARFVETDAPAATGDFVEMDFEGSVDGKLFEGGAAKDYRLELGSHTFIEGFEDQLIGVKAGEQKIVKVTFPENYPAPNLAGKAAEFKCDVKKVEKKEIPEVTDKLISFSTEFSTVEEYKNSIKEKMLEAKKAQAERKFENDLIEAAVAGAKLDLPKEMIEHECHHIVDDFKQRLMYQGIKLEDYLSYIGQSMEDFEKSKLEEAEKSLKTRLVLQKIIKDQNIQISHEEFHEKVHEIAHAQNKDCHEVEEGLSDYEISSIQNDILMNKIVAVLAAKNN